MTLALIEALAEATGGNIGPSCLFLGDLVHGPRIDHFVPKTDNQPYPADLSQNECVALDLLRNGAGMMANLEVAFDLDTSPVAAYIAMNTPHSALESVLAAAHRYFECETKASAVFAAFPEPVVATVCAVLVQILPTRAASACSFKYSQAK
jgi:hypothetical protein